MTHVAVLFDDFIPQGVAYKIITSMFFSLKTTQNSINWKYMPLIVEVPCF